jgi:hypothetical protein
MLQPPDVRKSYLVEGKFDYDGEVTVALYFCEGENALEASRIFGVERQTLRFGPTKLMFINTSR